MARQTITGSLSTSGRLSGALSVGGGTTDYNELENKPTYNGHIIEGDLTSETLGIWQPKNFSTNEQNTGLKWIDGKDIYVKVMYSTQQVQLIDTQWNIIPWVDEPTNIDLLIGVVLTSNVPNNSNNIRFAVINDHIRGASTKTGYFPPTATPVYVIFYYTKTN